MRSGEITIRVRYAETDRMGLLHHANYLIYFEQARTELLRGLGITYKELEDRGFYLVVAKLDVKFRKPVHYDDLLTIRTTETKASPVRLEHQYEVFRNGELCCIGTTTLGCVDAQGRIQAMPDWLSASKP